MANSYILCRSGTLRRYTFDISSDHIYIFNNSGVIFLLRRASSCIEFMHADMDVSCHSGFNVCRRKNIKVLSVRLLHCPDSKSES